MIEGLFSLILNAAVLLKKLRLKFFKFPSNTKTQIIAIGDSWLNRKMFDTKFYVIDTLDWLKQSYCLINCAIPGFTLQRELEIKLYKSAFARIDKKKQLIILLSLGGNDMLNILFSFIKGNEKKTRLQKSYLRKFIRHILMKKFYNYISLLLEEYTNCSDTTAKSDVKNVKVIMHGYDYFHPEKQPSSIFTAILKTFFEENKIPTNIANEIVRQFVDICNEEMQRLTKLIPTLVMIDLRGKIPKKYWGEQIHPTSEGYSIIARKFHDKIQKIAKSSLTN